MYSRIDVFEGVECENVALEEVGSSQEKLIKDSDCLFVDNWHIVEPQRQPINLIHNEIIIIEI